MGVQVKIKKQQRICAAIVSAAVLLSKHGKAIKNLKLV